MSGSGSRIGMIESNKLRAHYGIVPERTLPKRIIRSTITSPKRINKGRMILIRRTRASPPRDNTGDSDHHEWPLNSKVGFLTGLVQTEQMK
jgi:hypothetical protein